MVLDKVHSQADGERSILTQQPVQGKGGGKRGGLRTGWMESNAMSSSGAAYFIQDRYFNTSDSFAMWFCMICGLPAIQNHDKRTATCRVCRHNKCAVVKLPFATRLVFQLMMGTNTVPRILTDANNL